MFLLVCKPESDNTPAAVTPDLPVVLFMGDSLTAGFGIAPDESFPAQIQKKLQEDNLEYKVINGGRSGDTSAGGLDRLAWYLDSGLPIAHFVLCLGSNDAMRGLPLDQLEANLNQILARVKERFPDAKVYIAQLYTFTNLGDAYTKNFEKIYPRVAKAQGATLLPFILRDVAGQAHLNQPDGIHPNVAGTTLVADLVYQELLPALNAANEL